MVMGVAASMRRLVRRTARFHTAGRMISDTRPATSRPSAKYMMFSMTIGQTPKPHRHAIRGDPYLAAMVKARHVCQRLTLTGLAHAVTVRCVNAPSRESKTRAGARVGILNVRTETDQKGFQVGSLVNLR